MVVQNPVKRFIGYWWAIACDFTHISHAIAGILTAGLGIGLYLISGKVSAGGPIFKATGIAIGFLLFLWLPFHEHEKHQLEQVKEIEKLKEQIDNAQRELQEVKDDRKRQDEARAMRESARTIFAAYLVKLRDRVSTLREIGRYGYTEDVCDKQVEESETLGKQIAEQLDKLLGLAEMEFFAGANPPPRPYQVPNSMDVVGQRIYQWEWHIDVLEIKYAELKKIVEKLG